MGGIPHVWLLARVELHAELHPATLRHQLRLAMDEAGVPAVVISDVLLAAQEACNNALTHAADCARPAEVSVCIIDDHLIVEVGDRGGGFDVGDVLSGWPPELLEGHGRGLYLIDALSDAWEVKQRSPGTIVRMVKRIR
jgi:anti-sigma regulatory factor (Ser/Thr protein kinase)